MAIKLKDSSNVEVYEFPAGCNIVAEPWSKRQDSELRAYQHGSTKTGDEKVNERIISLHGIFNVNGVNATYGATLAANLKEMKQQCYTEDLRLYPGNQYTDEYYNIECLNFEHTFLQTITIMEIFIDFICSDPFRYYKDVTTDTETVDEALESMTVTNGGDAEIFPVITFTAGAGSNISVVRITNTTDTSKYFEYTPASNLTENDVLEIDCEEGTVELAGVDDMAHFNDGQFIKLLPGSNSLVAAITGTVGTNQCVFVFRNRWL